MNDQSNEDPEVISAEVVASANTEAAEEAESVGPRHAAKADRSAATSGAGAQNNARGRYSLNAIFLLVTVCAVIAGMINSGIRRAGEGGFQSGAAFGQASMGSGDLKSQPADRSKPKTFEDWLARSNLGSGDAVGGVAVLCALVGAVVGAVVGASRGRPSRNAPIGIVVGIFSGLAAMALLAFPPTAAALLVGCVVMLGTAALIRSVQK